MATAGDIVARLTADTKPFKKGLDEATGSLSSFESSATKMFATLAAGFSIGAVVSKATSAIKGQIAAVDELANVSNRLGIPIDQLSALSHAANMADVDFGAMTNGLQKMMNSIADAGDGASGPVAALQRIGLSFQDLAGLNASQQFGMIADGINKLEDPTRRVQTAMDLFGKSGAELLNIISGGSEGIAKATENATRFGLVINEWNAAEISALDDALKNMEAALAGLARTALSELAPSFITITDGLTNFIAGGKTAFAGLDALVKSLILRLESLKAALQLDFEWARDLWQQAEGLEGLANDIFEKGVIAAPAGEKDRRDFIGSVGVGDGSFGPQEGDFMSGPGGDGSFFDHDAMEAWKDALKDAADIIDGLRSPMDKLNEQWDRAQQLFDDGLLNEDQLIGRFAQIQDEMAKLQDAAGLPDEGSRLAISAEAGSSQAASILNAAQNASNNVGQKQLQVQQQTAKAATQTVAQLKKLNRKPTPPVFQL